MMNILYITENDPRRTDCGCTQRGNLLWLALQRLGNVYTVCLCDELIDEQTIKNVAIKKENRVTSFFRILQNALFWRIGLDGCGFLRKKLTKPIDTAFPGVLFDLYVSRYVAPFEEYQLFNYHPFLIDIDDHPFQVFLTTRLNRIPKIIRPFAVYLKKHHLADLETRFDGGWIANPLQASWVKTKYPIIPLLNLPPMPTSLYNENSNREPYLMMVGKMGYPPNYNGLKRFMREVWPQFHKLYPNIKIKVAGRNLPDDLIKEFQKYDSFEYLGFVNDLDSLYEKCLASVVPIDAGGGTCIKTLEAMSHSRVCLATPFGARGLEDTNQNGLYVYNTPHEFIDLFERQVLDIEERKKNEEFGKNFILENFSFEAFSSAVEVQVKNVTSDVNLSIKR